VPLLKERSAKSGWKIRRIVVRCAESFLLAPAVLGAHPAASRPSINIITIAVRLLFMFVSLSTRFAFIPGFPIRDTNKDIGILAAFTGKASIKKNTEYRKQQAEAV
jgi:hypothetical protein